MVIQINEFIETPSNKVEELWISNRNKFYFRFIIFIEEGLSKEDSSRRNIESIFFFNNIYIYILNFRFNINIYGSHGLVSIIWQSTNNSKDPHCKARIFEKQKNNNCKENEIFVLIISFSKRENNLLY